MNRHRATALVLCAGLLAAPLSHAEVILRLDSGKAELSHSAYKDARSVRLTAGYGFGPVSVSASQYEYEDFDLKDNRRGHLELESRSVQAHWRPEVGPVDLELGGGVYDWDSKIKLDDRTFGRDSGSSTFVEAGVSKTFGSLVGIYINTRWMDDVSGEELTTVSTGIQFGF